MRVVEALIDELNLAELGFARAVPAETGRPGYHPATMEVLHGAKPSARQTISSPAQCRQPGRERTEMSGSPENDHELAAETYANVWEALTDNPAEAADLTARSDLLIALSRRVRSWRLPRAKAAQRLGVSSDTLRDISNGRLMRCSQAELAALLHRAEESSAEG